jgi:UDP-N-acetylglucosamine:LPS N-acetylglucosamine transferase
VAPEFYEDSAAYKSEQRERLGLVRGIPAGLVMFGRQGASRLLNVARVMTRAQYPVQLIFVCGHDDQTADAIRALPTNYHKVVFGFVSDVHRHMAAADFFVGKPGPSSIAEALARGLPMILDFGWRTMLQDRYNAQWAADRGVAVLNRSMRKLPDSIRTLLDRYDQYSSAARTASTGKALFDVAAMLERYVAGARVRST